MTFGLTVNPNTSSTKSSPTLQFLINLSLLSFVISGAIVLLIAVYHTLIYVSEHPFVSQFSAVPEATPLPLLVTSLFFAIYREGIPALQGYFRGISCSRREIHCCRLVSAPEVPTLKKKENNASRKTRFLEESGESFSIAIFLAILFSLCAHATLSPYLRIEGNVFFSYVLYATLCFWLVTVPGCLMTRSLVEYSYFRTSFLVFVLVAALTVVWISALSYF